MSSIVFCLLLSCFTFHLGFVHPLQDVALHQCLPMPSVCCFPVTGGSLLPSFVVLQSSAWSGKCTFDPYEYYDIWIYVLGRPFDLFPLLGCHSVQRLVNLLSFILAMCPSYLNFCLS